MTKKPSQNTDLYKYIQLFYRTLYGRVHLPSGPNSCPLPHIFPPQHLSCTLTPTGPHKRHSQSPKLHKYCHQAANSVIPFNHFHISLTTAFIHYHQGQWLFWSSCFLIPFSFIQVHMSRSKCKQNISSGRETKSGIKQFKWMKFLLDILV